MSEDYRREIHRIFGQARGKSDSDVAMLEEAARIADRHNDVELGLQARTSLISAANFAGNHEMTLAAFTWCLAQLDRNEAVLDDHQWQILWYYKWVIDSLSEYAQVSRQQLETSFADMADRYKRAGYGLAAVHNCRAYSAIRLGEIEAHREARALWVNSPRDGLSDCPACQTDTAVAFDLEVGDLEKAIQTAAPIIKGRQRCAEVPCLTFGRLLLPMLKLGEAEQAENLHQRTIRQTLSSRDFLVTCGEHCAYLALIGQIAKSLRVFETGFSWVMIMRRTWDRMLFLQGAAVLFEQLAANGDTPVKVKIPANAPFYRNDDTYKPSAVAHALDQMRSELATDLNKRNGNDYMTARHHRFRELVAGIPRS